MSVGHVDEASSQSKRKKNERQALSVRAQPLSA